MGETAGRRPEWLSGSTASSFLVSISKPERVQLPGGTWEVRCCVHDKAHGGAYMAANPSRKVYEPAARAAQAATPKPARRCRPTKTAQRQQAEAEARKRRLRGIKPDKDGRRGRRRSGRVPLVSAAVLSGAGAVVEVGGEGGVAASAHFPAQRRVG